MRDSRKKEIIQEHKTFYLHDCHTCTFLGNHNGHDLYHHEDPLTLIARFSSRPEDYVSGMELIKGHHVLSEAYDRAVLFNLETGQQQ